MKMPIQGLPALALAALTTPAWASGHVFIPLPPLEVDESIIQVAAVMPFGQTFTAAASSVGTIWLRAINMNLGFPLDQDKSLTVNLYAGEGFAGALLATSTANVEAVIGSSLGAAGLIEFNFGTVPVIDGQMYSFEVKANSERYGLNWQNAAQYSGGTAIALGGAIPTTDLYFSVAAAVPEPASYQLLLLGLVAAAGMGAVKRKPRSKAEPD